MPTLELKKYHAWDRVVFVGSDSCEWGEMCPPVGTLGTVQPKPYKGEEVKVLFDGSDQISNVFEAEIEMWLYVGGK